MTPSGLRAVSPVPQPPPAELSSPKPPPRPAVSREISKATLAGGFHISSPSNPDLASTIEHGPMELSAQHLVPMDATELAAMGLGPPVPPPPFPPQSRPPTALSKTMPLPPVSKPAVQMREQMSSQSFAPPTPSYMPPFVEMVPQQSVPEKKSGSGLLWVLGAGFLVLLGALAGALLLVRSRPRVAVAPTASVAVASKPPPSASALATRPPPPVATPTPTPSAVLAASAPAVTSVSPVVSAPPVAVTATPPVASVAPPTPVDTSAPPSVDSFHGLIRLPMWSSGRRVWIDGKLVGEGPEPKVALCGAREVKIGSSGTEKLVNVPCGGEVDLSR